MNATAGYVLSLVLLLVAAVIVPWLVMRGLVPALEATGRGVVENYRGRRVVVALGLVWIVWALALMSLSLVDSLYADFLSADGMPFFSEFYLETLPFLLVVGAMAFGMIDDFLGSAAEKGFTGHLRALAHGRVTTGALKLFGVAILTALTMAPDFMAEDLSTWAIVGLWALETLAIGLTANLINLMDLRPGRALKVYSALVLASCVAVGVTTAWSVVPFVALVCLGPVVAVWGFDVGERGMLGDAGANAAGVLAGWVIVNALVDQWWVLAVYTAVALALNIASERVSFSAVIENVPTLRWLDGLGRETENSPPI